MADELDVVFAKTGRGVDQSSLPHGPKVQPHPNPAVVQLPRDGGISTRAPIYAKYEIFGSLFKLNTGGGAAK